MVKIVLKQGKQIYASWELSCH